MPSKPQPDKFLNFKEVAEMIGLAVETVKKGKAGTNELTRVKLGSRVVFSENDVRAWMARKVKKAEQDKLRSEMAVIDMLAEKRRRQIAVENTMRTIINGGGKYSR